MTNEHPGSASLVYKPSKDQSGIGEAINQEVQEILKSITGEETHESLAERITLALFRYRRPVKGVHDWLNRFLGPLPQDAVIVNPTKEAFKKVKGYWLFGFMTSILAMILIFGIATAFPFLSVSPLSLLGDGVRYFVGDGILGTVITVVVLMVMLRYVAKFFTVGSMPTRGGVIARFAMTEEQWFRMGSERWTVRQRVQSCVVFGLIHVQNLFYPVTSLIVVGLLGGVFMAVYLRNFRKTGDYQTAVLASARLHTVHNYFALTYFAIVLGYTAISALVS